MVARFEIEAGTPYDEGARQLQQAANDIGRSVAAEFNGVELVAHRGGDWREIVKQYAPAQCQRSYNDRAAAREDKHRLETFESVVEMLELCEGWIRSEPAGKKMADRVRVVIDHAKGRKS